MSAPTPRKVEVNYDAANKGYDLVLPLADPSLTGVQTFTMSAAATVYRTRTRTFKPDGINNTQYVNLPYEQNTVLTNLDTGVIAHEANNTAFNQDYVIPMPVTSMVSNIQVSAAFILNVSNWVDGSPILNYVEMTLAAYHSPGSPIFQPQVQRFSPDSAFTALAANGAHLFIVRGNIPWNFKAVSGGGAAVTLNIAINVTGTSANDTYQIGIVDMYPVHKSSATKQLFQSQLVVHAYPLPDHVEELNEFTPYSLEGTGYKK